ncbi:MAG: alpha/beta hydrolase, partial [Saprospiraceae bacterium]
MKNLYSLALLLSLFCTGLLNAQTRYLGPVFSGVTVTKNITYGVNATVLYYSVFGQAVPQALKMDVYGPTNDSETKRPLVIYLHTGNFLPFFNPSNPTQAGFNGSCGGERNDSAAVEICTRLAKMGYVAASADYRLGWNPLAATDVDRRYGIINAAYRGIQDVRTAIRYFKLNAAQYGVDTARIVLFGQGTGGYITLAAGTLDSYNKIPLAGNGKFFWDHDANPNTAPIPMVIPQVNGDIYGTSVGQVPNAMAPNGLDTLNYPNYPGTSSKFQLAVNLGGALADSSWIDPGQPALISFHVPNDNYAPYGQGIVNVPGTNLQVVEVQGSYIAQKLHQQYGNNNAFLNKPILDLKTNQLYAFAHSPAGFTTPYEGLYPFLVPKDPANPALPKTTAPWEWTSYVPTTPGATCNNNKSENTPYIDTIMRFYAPRACFALGLQSCINQIVGANEPQAENIELTAAPNPASSEIVIGADADHTILNVQVYDRDGRLVRNESGLNASTY